MITTARLVTAAALGAAIVLAPSVASAQDDQPTESQEAEATLTVMARNLYLGADYVVALEQLPDVPAAAQYMWDQVADTNFDVRAEELASEIERYAPDVIGLQEATVWGCRTGLFGGVTPVFDFTEGLIEALAAKGEEYVVAEAGGVTADNPGQEIPAVPFLTTVSDPETFQPIFGRDSAYCGYYIGDALLVRSDLADDVLTVGNTEFDERAPIVPVVFTVSRGYTWADIAYAGTTVRVATAHLEAYVNEDGPPSGAVQAQQLVDDLAQTTVPLVVMGDFNADPRDPRAPDAPNPGDQPVANDACSAQPDNPTLETANIECNAYWVMRGAGYEDVGPDPLDPTHYTWGAAANLAGPDPDRLTIAVERGNNAGFTDRLDYIFLANGAEVVSSEVIGHEWPEGDDLWECTARDQVATTEESSAILADAGVADAITGEGVCLPTDHAGIVAVVDVSAGPSGVVEDPAPPAHDSFTISLLGWLAIIVGVLLLLVVLLVVGIVVLVRRSRRRRRDRQAESAVTTAG
jgi:endonuclease/exonuclease/phosphatase family metal-dependent hydrolase